MPSIIYFVRSKNVLNTTYNQDKVIIDNYLKDEFGEEYFNSMEIIKSQNISEKYEIKTPLLNEPFEIYLDEDRAEVISNSFYENFVNENDLNDKLNNYLNEYYKFPEYLKISSSINNFDIKDTNNIENLLKNCNYQIDEFYILKETYNKEEIIEIIKDYFLKYDQSLKEHYIDNYLMFYVRVNNKKYARIQSQKNKNNDGLIHLFFRGYNFGDHETIKDEELTISIYNGNEN